MKKLIKLEFNNTTRERKTEDSYSELYSYDKNNGSFEFEILNDTLTTEQVTALFKFTESNKIWKTTGIVEGNKVKVTFDTTLITQNETVICYLYFDEEQRTSDTYRFKFKVKVSEIDKMNRYEVKERFINNTVIVDRLDVVTKDELKEALKNVGGIATEGLLTEAKAEEIYAKKSEAVDNTNFELVKNRVLALELKTDKDTVYDDSEVKERLTTLENKAPVDLSNYATKEELNNISGSQPNVDNLVTKEELENKHYISDVSNLATKDELQEVRNSQPTVDISHLVTKDELKSKGYLTELYLNSSELSQRVSLIEEQPDKDTIYDDTEVKRRLTELESKPVVDTSVFVTEEALNNKAYLTSHQDLSNYALKSEIPQPYNDSSLTERITALENRPTTGGNIDTSKFVTGEMLESELEQLASNATKPLYIPYHNDSAKNYLDNTTIPSEKTFPDKRAGKILANVDKQNLENIQIFKGDENNSQFVDFDAAMYSLANSLPTDYNMETVRRDLNNKVIFLSNKNFSEVVPRDELKAVIKEVAVQSTGGVVTSTTSSEIRGTGMPNGVVEAPIGATYIDTAKTNGALKWIKTTDGGNTGWKVVEGDTGWITIFQGIVWRDFVNRLMIRRINNTVNVVFEGLGDVEGIFFDKTAYPHNLDLVNVKVTDGFKPVSRITLPTLNYASFYNEDHVFTVGTITFDVIDGMFKITLFSEQGRVNRMSSGLANINFNYVTYEGWPTELPAQN